MIDQIVPAEQDLDYRTSSQPERSLRDATLMVNEIVAPEHGTLGSTVHGIFPDTQDSVEKSDFSAAPGASVALASLARGWSLLPFSTRTGALPSSVARYVASTARAPTSSSDGTGGGCLYVCNNAHANDPDKSEALLGRLHGALPNLQVVGGAAGGWTPEVVWTPTEAPTMPSPDARDAHDGEEADDEEDRATACGFVLIPPDNLSAPSSSFSSRCLPGYRPIGRRMLISSVSVEPAEDGSDKILLIESLDNKAAASAVHAALMEHIESSRGTTSARESVGGVVLGIADDEDDLLAPCEFYPSTRRRHHVLPIPATPPGSRGAAGDAAGAPKTRRGRKRSDVDRGGDTRIFSDALDQLGQRFNDPPGTLVLGDGSLEVTGACGARVGGIAQLMARDEASAKSAAEVCVKELADDTNAAFLFGCWGAPHAVATARLLLSRFQGRVAVQAGLFNGEVANSRADAAAAPGRGRMHAYSCALALVR